MASLPLSDLYTVLDRVFCGGLSFRLSIIAEQLTRLNALQRSLMPVVRLTSIPCHSSVLFHLKANDGSFSDTNQSNTRPHYSGTCSWSDRIGVKKQYLRAVIRAGSRRKHRNQGMWHSMSIPRSSYYLWELTYPYIVARMIRMNARVLPSNIKAKYALHLFLGRLELCRQEECTVWLTGCTRERDIDIWSIAEKWGNG